MSIFQSIMHAIWPSSEAAETEPTGAAETATAPTGVPATGPLPKPAAMTDENVEDILQRRADERGVPSNWRTSIVDLLKLLDLDSSLTARKQLADELNIHVAGDGTAEENIALHRGVMQALAVNGGNVPDSLRD